MRNNTSITLEIQPIIEELDDFFSQSHILEQLTKITNTLLPKISDKSPYAVEDITLDKFDKNIPKTVGSIRVAVFFPKIETKIERHPNSTQYLFSISGTGKTRVLRNNNWETDNYGDSVKNPPLEMHWHFVEKGVWHQSIASGNSTWVLVAIHSAKSVEDEYEES